MSMMYNDYFENILLKAEIKFKIIKDIVPPILNEQKWFVIEPIAGYKQEFEKKMDEFIQTVLEKEHALPFLFVKERQQDLLERIYFLDFNLPVQKVRERFSAKIPEKRKDEIQLRPFFIKSFLSVGADFFSHEFFLYNKLYGIHIISTEFYSVNIPLIIRSALEGHKIPFEVKDKIVYYLYHLKEREKFMIFYIKPYNTKDYDASKQKVFLCNEFYYDNGIIKFPYDTSKIDNHFLAELKELIEILCQVIIEIARRKGSTDFYEGLIDKLIFGKARSTISCATDKPNGEKGNVIISFSRYRMDEKLHLFYEIESLCIIIIEHFLGIKLEPVKNMKEIEKRKEYLIENLKIINEILSIVA